MPIVPSPGATVHALLARLDDAHAVTRDAAAARLRLHGEAAVEALLRWLERATPVGRRAAVSVLEALDDVRARAALARLCGDSDDRVAERALEAGAEAGTSPGAPEVVRAAVARLAAPGAARAGVRDAAVGALLRLHRAGVVEALEPLLDVLLDESRDDALRLAAAAVLEDLAPRERRPVLARLARGTCVALRERAAALSDRAGSARPAGALLRSLLGLRGRAPRAAGGTTTTPEAGGRGRRRAGEGAGPQAGRTRATAQAAAQPRREPDPAAPDSPASTASPTRAPRRPAAAGARDKRPAPRDEPHAGQPRRRGRVPRPESALADRPARSAPRAPEPVLPPEIEHAVQALGAHGADAIAGMADALCRAPVLGDDAAARVAAALAALGPPALPALQRALEHLSRAPQVSDAARAEAKAVLHLGLARLDSRLALYDLREMLAARPPRALARLLAAASTLGDGSVALALVRLVAAAPALRDPCAPAFAAIVEREHLTRRARAFKALPAAEGVTLDALWPRRG